MDVYNLTLSKQKDNPITGDAFYKKLPTWKEFLSDIILSRWCKSVRKEPFTRLVLEAEGTQNTLWKHFDIGLAVGGLSGKIKSPAQFAGEPFNYLVVTNEEVEFATGCSIFGRLAAPLPFRIREHTGVITIKKAIYEKLFTQENGGEKEAKTLILEGVFNEQIASFSASRLIGYDKKASKKECLSEAIDSAIAPTKVVLFPSLEDRQS